MERNVCKESLNDSMQATLVETRKLNKYKKLHIKNYNCFFLGLTRKFSLGYCDINRLFCVLCKKKNFFINVYRPDSKSFKSESAMDSSLKNISFPVKHVDPCN